MRKAAAIAVFLLFFVQARAQLSNAVADDLHIEMQNNKYLHREAFSDRRDPVKSDEKDILTCGKDIAVRWHTEVTSSIYATPLITDLYSDGRKDIIIPGFRRRLHILEGRTGAEDNTFEAQHKSTLHSSPLLYDVDFDGVLDIIVATYDGDIQFFRDTGIEAAYRLFIPRLRVKRDWFKGLNPDPNDHSHPDVGADIDDSGLGERRTGRALKSIVMHEATVQQGSEISQEAADSFEELFADDDDADDSHINNDSNNQDWLDDYLVDEGEDYEEEDGPDNLNEDNFIDIEDPGDDYDYDDRGVKYEEKAELWDEETDTIAAEERSPEVNAPYVWIDAHVMATPAIGDIDGDGREDLVVPVSYFFDPGDYAIHSTRAHAALGKEGDPGKYLASGIVVFDLHTRGIKWSQHLDLSTRYTRYKAEIHSTPTLADINKDGKLEVIVGTSMGWVYVLDAKSGTPLEGWPIQLGDVQGQVAVADIDNDGWLEIIAGDTRGSIASLRINGKEVWERHVGSAIGAGVTVGDVDGDGYLEIVFGTFDGRIYVMDAASGVDKPNFPFRTYGRITNPVMITKLSDPNHKPWGQELVVTSHDGFLYVIDGNSACADSVDLGEPSYAMVLADDLANTGRLDLLVATAGGNVYGLRTSAKFQPLKTWTSQTPGLGTAGFVSKWDWEGIYATATSRVPRDVRGEAVQVRVTVVDKRPPLPGGKPRGPYKVSVSLQGVGAKEMNAGNHPVIGMSNVVNKTGTYTMEVPCPRTRTSAVIRVEMKDETGAIFADEFALSFHIHFYRLLKWLTVGPFAFTVAAILFMTSATARSHFRSELPS